MLLGPGAEHAPLAILASYGIVRAVGIAIGTALNGSGAARAVTLSATLNTVLIASLVVPAYRVAGTGGVAAVVLLAMTGAVLALRQACHQHDASLDFLGPPAVGVGFLVLLVVAPLEPAALVVRVATGAIATILAARWAWRVVRTGRVGVATVTGAT